MAPGYSGAQYNKHSWKASAVRVDTVTSHQATRPPGAINLSDPHQCSSVQGIKMALTYLACHALHTGMRRTQFCYNLEITATTKTLGYSEYVHHGPTHLDWLTYQPQCLEECILAPRKTPIIRTLNELQDWQKPYIQIFTTIWFCSQWRSGLHSSLALLPRSVKSFQRHHNSHTEISSGILRGVQFHSLPTFREVPVPSWVMKSSTIRLVISHIRAELIYIAADGWNHTQCTH